MIRPLHHLPGLCLLLACPTALASSTAEPVPRFVSQMKDFAAQEAGPDSAGVLEQIGARAAEVPFFVVASVIFLCAIVHTFFAVPLTRLAHRVQHAHDTRIRRQRQTGCPVDSNSEGVSFKATMLEFLGEVEAIFGIWVIVLLAAIVGFYDVDSAKTYMSSVDYTEAVFVVVIMALASTRPVLQFAENCLRFAAKIGNETPAAWWLSILIIAPLLGSFITEPGAMTIGAMLLARKFYRLRPTPKFAYATLGLLFVNISIGGTLTNFAAPPVLMVAGPDKWDLTTLEMFVHFGEKAVIGILVSTATYYLLFRRELELLAKTQRRQAREEQDAPQTAERSIPTWVTMTHLLFMAWTVFNSHTPSLFIFGFLFFLAFREATADHQNRMELRGPVLVGFFLAGLVIHGGLQGWWLEPVITSLSEWPLFAGSVMLTSFNDNAAITFLASQVEGLAPQLKYAVLAGAVSGGGLTVIANAPNPAGQAILGRFFGDGVSPIKLALAAIIPTLIVATVMMAIPDPHIETIFEPSKTPAETPTKTPSQ